MTIFAIENEAIHNKDYSVVKTSRAGLRTRSFLLTRENILKLVQVIKCLYLCGKKLNLYEI